MRTSLPSAHTFWAYTLVELLIALALSLLLLIGVIELFSRVSGVMSGTRITLNLSANLDGVENQLRQDLARIPLSLATKPVRIAEYIDDPDVVEVSDLDGYLEIVEGPNSVSTHPYKDENGRFDVTVGDVDDIIAFTAKADSAMPFRGLIGGKIEERNFAEIVWFVRGNTLYRRVRLIDDHSISSKIDPTVNTIQDLAHRERRFGHDGLVPNPFPHPLYDVPNSGWYYLRMPTLEETLSGKWTADWKSNSTVPNSPSEMTDLWEQPHFFPELQDRKSGSLKEYVGPPYVDDTHADPPRHHRAGEDVILTNVLSFDIKVWDPITKDFVDLRTPGTAWEDSKSAAWTDKDDNPLPQLLGVWDSWTIGNNKMIPLESGDPGYDPSDPDKKKTVVQPPPFDQPLKAIQITIRCFDPASKIIKQISVVHHFNN